MENQSLQSFHQEQIRKKTDLQTTQIVKAKCAASFSPKTIHSTAPHSPSCFHPFALASLAHLPRTVNSNNSEHLFLCTVESYGQERSLEILGIRQPAAERWTKDSHLELFGSAAVLQIVRKQLRVSLYEAIPTITA